MRTITELRAELERIRQHRRVAPPALARVLLGAEVALDWALDAEAPSLLEHDGADLDFLVGEPDEELGRLIETVTATFPPPIEPLALPRDATFRSHAANFRDGEVVRVLTRWSMTK